MLEFLPIFKNLSSGSQFNIKNKEKPMVETKTYAKIYFYLKKLNDSRSFSSQSFYWIRDVDLFLVYHESQVEVIE